MAKLIEITGKVLSGEWGTDDESGNGIPVLRTTNFTNEGIVDYSNVVTRTIQKKNIDAKYLRKGDIIIEKSGGSDKQPVGRVIYFDGPESTYLFNNFTGLLRVKNQAVWLPRYVFYSLFHNYRKGGTRPFESKTTGLHNLKTDDYISRYEVLEAPISEQQSICKQLDYVYDIIKTRQQQLQKLDELVKARFVEFFGDPILNQKQFPVYRMDEVVEFQGGSQPDKKFFEYEPTDDNIRLIQIRDYKTDKFITYIPRAMAKRFCTADDIMIGRYGPPIFQILQGIEGSFNVALMKATPKKGNKEFVRQFLKQECLLDYLEGMSKRTAGQDGIQMDKLKAYPFPLPPVELQNQFEKFVNQVDKSKVAVQKSLDEAQLLFDSLMQQYFG